MQEILLGSVINDIAIKRAVIQYFTTEKSSEIHCPFMYVEGRRTFKGKTSKIHGRTTMSGIQLGKKMFLVSIADTNTAIGSRCITKIRKHEGKKIIAIRTKSTARYVF